MGPDIKGVHFIRARRLNHQLFQKFLNDLDTEHQDLLYFSEVRWLSKGCCVLRCCDDFTNCGKKSHYF